MMRSTGYHRAAFDLPEAPPLHSRTLCAMSLCRQAVRAGNRLCDSCAARAVAPPPEDLGSEHQELLADIAEHVRRHAQIERGIAAAKRTKSDALAQAQDASEEIANWEEERNQLMSSLSADAQQLLVEAGIVRLDGQEYRVDPTNKGICLRRASVLELDR